MEKLRVVVSMLALVAGGCSSSSSAPSTAAAPATVTQTIGPEGGQIVVDGATVTFAKSAVTSAQAITITASTTTAPDGFVALSRVYTCEPSGLNFGAQVTMQMQFTPDGSPATMFWSSATNPTFAELANVETSGNTMTATVAHFSSGFVGRRK
jgi:hypothetical protein